MAKARDLLAENLKRLREASGWTQPRLAEKADLSLKMIQKIEYGKTSPTLETLDKISYALHAQVADLFRSVQSLQSKHNVHQLRPDPKAVQAMQEAQQVLKELAEDVPQILRLSAIFLLTGDAETKARLLALPNGAHRVRVLGKLRLAP